MEKFDRLGIKFCVVVILSLFCLAEQTANYYEQDIHFLYNNTYKYNVLYVVNVSRDTEYIMEFAGDNEVYDTPARITVASDLANRTFPLFVTARQQKGIFSWQLPMLVETPTSSEQFTNVSRTLCPHDNIFDEDEDSCDISSQSTPIVHLTSSSPTPIQVTVIVETVTDFFIPLNRLTELTVTPSQPQYYFFPFKNNDSIDLSVQNYRKQMLCSAGERDRLYKSAVREREGRSWLWKPKSVILMIESSDDVCAVVSIQNASCPVFDNERDILYDGYYLTMTRKGGITLMQDQFPYGFYIVFIVKSSDEDCLQSTLDLNSTTHRVGFYSWNDDLAGNARVKNFTFKIVETISYQEYLIGASAMMSFFLSFYLAFVIAVLVKRRVRGQEQSEGTEDTAPLPTPNESSQVRRRHTHMQHSQESTSSQQLVVNDCSSSSSESDAESPTLHDIEKDIQDGRVPVRLSLEQLSKQRPRVLAARSRLYLYSALTVAVFYMLPVLQLVVTYQRMLNQSGNQDLCYYNFLCAHPLLMLSDFNHVYSNLGYVLLGLLFIVQVYRRHRIYKGNSQKNLGIPQHFGLLYAMGVSLVSEGILSAAYHVCPNNMNFQFDTSFMYVTGVLCMVKVYQNRHPDINARAHATFGVLAVIISIGVAGVLNASLYIWIAFTILHLTTCLVMTFQIYYMGRFKIDGTIISRGVRELTSRPLAAITPSYAGRCILLALANIVNISIAAYGISQHNRDFCSHLLLVIMSNLFLYTLFYIVMKLLYRESIKLYSWVFIVLTYTIWFSSSYFYLDQSTNWALTPAESRRANKMCTFLQMYDSHDIWHFMSSVAMFFSFNMYLTIDDNLAVERRSNIMVF